MRERWKFTCVSTLGWKIRTKKKCEKLPRNYSSNENRTPSLFFHPSTPANLQLITFHDSEWPGFESERAFLAASANTTLLIFIPFTTDTHDEKFHSRSRCCWPSTTSNQTWTIRFSNRRKKRARVQLPISCLNSRRHLINLSMAISGHFRCINSKLHQW